jgi:hypothetical protein
MRGSHLCIPNELPGGYIMKFAVFMLLLISPASYASHSCVGKVYAVDVSASGTLHVNVGDLGDGNLVCYLNKVHGVFTAESCKAAFSLFLTAKMTGKNVRLWFANDTNPSCSKGHWVDLATHGVYHVRTED